MMITKISFCKSPSSRSGLDTKRCPVGLTLTELEATTCLWLTRLLTLNLTAIACQESGILQLLLVILVDLYQCTSNGKAQSLALTSEATTVEVDFDIILLSNLQQVQRLLALITSIFPYYLYWLISIVFGC